jgi:hypothetical protein
LPITIFLEIHMLFNSTTNAERRLKIVYRAANYDAFIAAFVYWYLSGDSAPIIAAIPPAFAGGRSQVPPQAARENFSFGTHLANIGTPATRNMFFSFENNPTFNSVVSEDARKLENDLTNDLGARYYYRQNVPLTQQVLEALHDDGHIKKDSDSFKRLNQFFLFYEATNGTNLPFQHKGDVREKILTWFPDLAPADFIRIKELVNDPFSGMKNPRTAADRDQQLLNGNRIVEDHQALHSTYLSNRGLTKDMVTWCFNASMDTPRAAEIFSRKDADSIIFKVVSVREKGVATPDDPTPLDISVPRARVRVLSRTNGVALDAFAHIAGAQVIGNELDAEWLLPVSVISELCS